MYLRQEADPTQAPKLLRLIDMAIEILTIMDESVVAQQVAKLLRDAKSRFESGSLDGDQMQTEPSSPGGAACNTNHWARSISSTVAWTRSLQLPLSRLIWKIHFWSLTTSK